MSGKDRGRGVSRLTVNGIHLLVDCTLVGSLFPLSVDCPWVRRSYAGRQSVSKRKRMKMKSLWYIPTDLARKNKRPEAPIRAPVPRKSLRVVPGGLTAARGP